MQIRSWQIALLGVIPNIIILLLVAYGFMVIRGHDIAYGLFFGFIALIGLGMVILPTLCLKSGKDNIRKIGATISIVFGLIAFVGVFGIVEGNITGSDDFIIAIIMLTPGFLLLLAGIYYFWKKI